MLIFRKENGRIDIELDGSDSEHLAPLLQPRHDSEEEDAHSTGRGDDTTIHSLTPPRLNIVLQVVGSRGDLQPFLALGLALQQSGHRVRVATHPVFQTFVQDIGLEFFSIGGDPLDLMSYVVKNSGLVPNAKSILEGSVNENRRIVREILEGCWRSCFETGDGLQCSNKAESSQAKPFVANAIIANPPSFAHIHCAEKMGVPLQFMFTMPWSPTRELPHPFTNIKSSSVEENAANYVSYYLVELLTWQGLGSTINAFRQKTLGLDPIDIASALALIPRLRIHSTYCWSPSLLSKPRDWESHLTVSGFCFLPLVTGYTPSHDLNTFLDSGPPPIYIGFGSIVVDDPKALTEMVLDAIRLTGVRAVISTGWGTLLEEKHVPRESVIYIKDCPHDWIFRRVSCVVHHGGAGTTAAALVAGKPSVIIPFFGDQFFWGNTIANAGAGPKPIHFENLSAASLAAAIQTALQPGMLTAAQVLQDKICREDGITMAVQSFHRMLPVAALRCTLDETRAATWRVLATDEKLSARAAALLIEKGLLNIDEIEMLQPCKYTCDLGPWDPLTGTAFAALDIGKEFLKGVSRIGSAFVIDRQSAKCKELVAGKSRALHSITGLGRVCASVVQGPAKVGVAFTQGMHNAPKLWGDHTVRPQEKVDGFRSGWEAGGKELFYGVRDGLCGLAMEPVIGARRRGVVGGISGIGIGALSSIVKTASGVSGAIIYPLKGIEKSIAKRWISRRGDAIEDALLAQGKLERAGLTEDECNAVIRKWQTCVSENAIR
ncbi:UDP-glucose,sterol transferase [Aspergillus alliaceus]|uniref:UDP-glucose,sterol transferase n=1 Tax=Petromyces alliaceus TaxID=209559 RepID=A0A5N7CA29_PETAA|nr:UDP-glucose,sterol transferase [Aspergillus alliaceus]